MISFICECSEIDEHNLINRYRDAQRCAFRVTDVHGTTTICLYCSSCETTARENATEIVSVEPAEIIVSEPYAAGVAGQACVLCDSAWPSNERASHDRACPMVAT